MVLNEIRCKYCENVVRGSYYNEIWREARKQGWDLPFENPEWPVHEAVCFEHVDDEGEVHVPEHIASWTAGCDSCEWEADYDTEDEAKRAERHHDCDDYRDKNETYIVSPEQKERAHESRVQAKAWIEKQQEEKRVAEEKKNEIKPKIGQAIAIRSRVHGGIVAGQIMQVYKDGLMHPVEAVVHAVGPEYEQVMVQYSTDPYWDTWCYPDEMEEFGVDG